MADENMQMGAIDETKLVRRTGGKNVKTQLSKGDPDIIPDLVKIPLCIFCTDIFNVILFRNT